jgi:hypothetical protein
MTLMPVKAPVAVTLDDVISHLAIKGIDNAEIWKHLDRTDRTKLATLLAELDVVEAEEYDLAAHAPLTKRSFQSDKSARKGKLFEKLAYELLAGLTCFAVRADVTTDVNQLDLLVGLEPSSGIVPAFRLWGSHFICECKFHETAVGVDWVEKLHSILRTHKANVGLLISKKGIAKVGRGRSILQLLHMLAVDNTYILCLGRDDIEQCISGGGLLQMITDQYVAVSNGIPSFMREKILA